MSDAVYTLEDGLFVASGHARGPWDPDAQHGGAPSALLARAFERLEAPGPMLLSRIAIEFLGPVPMGPLEVRAELTRPGKRLQFAEGLVLAEGREVMRARAVRLRREHVDVPPDAIPAPRLRSPEELEATRVPAPVHGAAEGFGPTAMELRFVSGAFGEPGPATAWFRLTRPLVAGEEPTGAQRAIAAGDFGNGIGAELRFGTHLFVNTDLTIHLSREPEGEWIANEAATEHGPEGAAVAAAVLHDVRGPIGRAAQSLYVAGR